MTSYYARGVVLTLGLMCLASGTQAQDYLGQPSLLPMPATAQGYPAQQVAYENLWNDPPSAPSPSDRPTPPPDGSVVSGDYKDAMSSDWSCTSGVCGGNCNGGCCGNGWFVYAGGLFMTRNNEGDLPMSFDTGGPNSVLCNCMVDQNLAGGFEVTGGKSFNCGRNALAVTYWGLYPGTQYADAYASDMVGNLNAIMDFSNLTYDDGNGAQTGDNYFDNAARHRLSSSSTIQNIEVNLLGGCCGGNNLWNCGCNNCCGNRFSCNWIAGIRYFQFNDNLSLASDNADDTFDGDLNEVYYDIRTTNSLLGFQLGGGVNYCLNSAWSLYGTGKAGLYGNSRSSEQAVYGGNGEAIVASGAYAGQNVWTHGNSNGLAMIGQLDVGAKWNINCRWSAMFGYRVLGISGVATAPQQLPSDVTNLGAMSEIDNNGALLLHGGYGGLQFCF